MIRTFQDIPISDISQDQLGREDLVDLIVESIKEQTSKYHECIVYGIYGKWGEGKTSLMNFIRQRLQTQLMSDSISLVEYNPWLIKNDEALLKEFFKSLMIYPDSNVKELFKKYGSLAILASRSIINAFSPQIGEYIAGGIDLVQKALEDTDSVAELKKKVSNAIEKKGHHLVVMMDDADRLDKEELHTILRLVRQVADFPNCIYVIAMDVDMVSKAIGEYHGGGANDDGRQYIDKIVQIPIHLPRISDKEMNSYAMERLIQVFGNEIPIEEVSSIAKQVSPFFTTLRSLKRYCNQLSFVLPHLKGEVNTEELCLLEAIKNVSTIAYDRIYEHRSFLLREVDLSDYVTEGRESEEIVERNYKQAVSYIIESLSGRIKNVVEDAINRLFNNRSADPFLDLDQKRIVTPVYFMKYFVSITLNNVIPDRRIRELRGADVDSAKIIFDTWINRFPVSEIKRAAIQCIRSYSNPEEKSSSASVIVKALSISNLAQRLPEHAKVNSNDISAFVPIAIIQRYMFFKHPDISGIFAHNSKLLDDTFAFVFQNAEMDFCMNLFSFSTEIFNSGLYDGRNVIPIIIGRFNSLCFEEQFNYSKLQLTELFHYWQKIDLDSFNSFANRLFSDKGIPYLRVFDKIIDGTDINDVNSFVELFYQQINTINTRISEDVDGNPHSHKSVKQYSMNFKLIAKELAKNTQQ